MRQAALIGTCFLAAIMIMASFGAHATTTVPHPFVATYAVTFRGLSAGTLTMRWSREGDSNRYVFETKANPSALAKLVVSGTAFERTTVELTAQGLRPLIWEADGGRSGEDGNGKLEFDWANNVVAGTYEGKSVRLPLEPGMFDRLSIQIGVMAALIDGQEPGTVAMVNGDDIRHYTYSRGKAETLASPMGELQTQVYESTRTGSNRVSRVWHVPSLEYAPARAEQVRKGKVETVMTLVELKKE